VCGSFSTPEDVRNFVYFVNGRLWQNLPDNLVVTLSDNGCSRRAVADAKPPIVSQIGTCQPYSAFCHITTDTARDTAEHYIIHYTVHPDALRDLRGLQQAENVKVVYG